MSTKSSTFLSTSEQRSSFVCGIFVTLAVVLQVFVIWKARQPRILGVEPNSGGMPMIDEWVQAAEVTIFVEAVVGFAIIVAIILIAANHLLNVWINRGK